VTTSATDFGVYHVLLRGDLDFARAHELTELVDQYQASRDTNVDVDLSEVTFIDSTGLGFLIRLRKVASPRGGTVTLIGPSAMCRRLLELVAVPTLFDIRD
jgi:anti-sigma B factor antagonist